MSCPCKSQKNYEECCKPYHTGELLPSNALLLMRSRYSAYALGLAEYIIETTHPTHPETGKKIWDWREDILHFSRDTEFVDLEILSFEETEQEAFVTFTASLKQQDKDFCYTEKSLFEKQGDLWLYKDAEFL
jgi:SEC-C motif-containing protein